jgi:hypothetical protein
VPNKCESSSVQKLKRDQWLKIRKDEGHRIAADTAEVSWTYANGFDPYHVIPDLPAQCVAIGREFFARAPGSDIWVWFGDLPDATRERLWSMRASKLAAQARLPGYDSELGVALPI